MPTQNVWIKKGNSSTGELELTRRGKNIAYPGDTVHWKIEQNSGVRRVTSILEKPDSTDIFSTDPYEQSNHWKAIVDVNARVGDVYKYSIHWIDEGNNPHIYDPKITVRPPSFIDSAIKFIAFSLVAVGSILALKHLFRAKNRR